MVQFLCRCPYILNLVLVEVGNKVDDDPRQGTAKVDNLVHNKGHDAGGENVVVHPDVVGEPHALKVVERDIVLGDFVEIGPVATVGGQQGRLIGDCCVPERVEISGELVERSAEAVDVHAGLADSSQRVVREKVEDGTGSGRKRRVGTAGGFEEWPGRGPELTQPGCRVPAAVLLSGTAVVRWRGLP